MSKNVRIVLIIEAVFLLAAPFFVGVPFTLWLKWLAPPFAVTFAALFLFYPPWTAAFFYGLKMRRAAARYAGWIARRCPVGAFRRIGAAQSANFFQELGEDARAAEMAERGIVLCEPSLDSARTRALYAHCINVLGMQALRRGNFQDALQAFYRPLRMNLAQPVLVTMFQNNCASAFHSLGEWESGLDYARRAIAAAPSAMPLIALLANFNAAQNLEELKRTDAALTHAQAAAEIKAPPAFRGIALALVGRLRAQSGDSEGAERALAEADALTRNLPPAEAVRRAFVLAQRGRVFLETGDFDAAERDLRDALASSEVNSAALYFLAQLARRRGDEAQAAQWRERLIRDVPESFYAHRAAEGIIVAQ